MEKRKILVMFSGGLDSLGTVYKLLTDKEYKDYSLHIHHINIKNIENRTQAESISVQNCLQELRKLGFNFEYSESGIDIPSYKSFFIYDTDILNFFAGYICSVNPDIELVAMGMTASDENHTVQDRIVRANKILTAFKLVKKIYPVLNLTKLEIYNSLPEVLKNKFWSCRRPVYKQGMIIPCNQCHTCAQLKKDKISVASLVVKQ